MLSIALPHADWWNTWYRDYGNTPEGFAELNAEISEAAEKAGRDPAEIKRSACAHVVVDPDNPEREIETEVVTLDGFRSHVQALGEAGADEVIVVAGPINEASIRALLQ
jgi:alkanesulfonate monooxygenase SsuD/methylene tetrahydromethanopterin reductase-like flavin-dependent oxidoreductase (luciferase family)